METINVTKKYVESQLDYASMYPADARIYEQHAFGAVELACHILCEQESYKASKILEDKRNDEWRNLFHQLYW